MVLTTHRDTHPSLATPGVNALATNLLVEGLGVHVVLLQMRGQPGER